MKQDPLNDKVKPGATVQITISKGPEPGARTGTGTRPAVEPRHHRSGHH